MDDYLLRGINSQLDLSTANAQHGHADVVVDADGFAGAAGEYQHLPSPWLSSRCPLSEWAEVMLYCSVRSSRCGAQPVGIFTMQPTPIAYRVVRSV
ncbi:hypothetical protein D9M72_649510 [compost metagenome]